ncbi:MAG: FkbM family methyltransferase [Flavobacteriales bacterium]|nr:FkbM family methyltransferase [Flavobacteriales bacterium]
MKKKIFRLLPNFLRRIIRRRYYFKKFSEASLQEEKDLQLIPLLIHPGDTVLDIGANYGLYTRFFAQQVGKSGTVHSFEPVPATFDVLKNNVEKAGLSQVKVHLLAISNLTGTATISVPVYPDGSENFYEATLQQTASGKGIVIQTLRLDEWLNSFSALHFVKMDVEGHEPSALEGMNLLIEKFHPAFLIEINDDFSPGTTGKQVKQMMENWGYTMYFYEHEKLRPSTGKENGVNYVFLYNQERI